MNVCTLYLVSVFDFPFCSGSIKKLKPSEEKFTGKELVNSSVVPTIEQVNDSMQRSVVRMELTAPVS